MQASKKRLKNNWEPLFDPTVGEFSIGSWMVKSGGVRFRDVLDFRRVYKDLNITEDSIVVYKNILFFECDLTGYLPKYGQVVFIDCRFFRCDFAKSWLHGIKFTECKFDESSFTLSDLNSSEFRDCIWKNVWFSGNETKILDCYVTNPEEFVLSAANYSKRDGYLWFVTEGQKEFLATKANAARSLLYSLRRHGSESEFYEAVKLHEITQGKSRIAERMHERHYFSALFYFVQLILIRILGFLSDWGGNPLKPFLSLILSCLIFTLVYDWLPFEVTLAEAFEKSFDITLLVGFALEQKYAEQNDILRTFHGGQLIISIVLYASVISTLIGRISRVK
ncbi:MAG: hypothetical protein ACSHXY_14235 [Alphaproteobacteria bacterium]